MAKRTMGIIAFLFCLCLCFMPCDVHAVSTADANEFINTSADCILTVSYAHNGSGFADVGVKLYHIADISEDFQYSPHQNYVNYNLELNGIQTQDEWDVIRDTLVSHIVADGIQPAHHAVTDGAGQAVIQGLNPGLYMLSAVELEEDGITYTFDATLLSLPTLEWDSVNQRYTWAYTSVVAPKPGVLPPIGGDSDTEYRVLKLWKADRYHSRPKSVQVEIFKDGKSHQTVTLSADNNWTYSWIAKDNADWMVVERNVPKGYTVTVDERDGTFVLTNTAIPDPYRPPGSPPKTGDSTNMLLYLAMLYGSGVCLVLLGIFAKRKRL